MSGPGGIGRHPVEIYTAIALAVVVVLLVIWKRRPTAPGVVAAVAIASAASIRALTEPLRPGLGSDLALWYWLGAGVAGIGAVALVRRRPDDTGT